MTPTIHAVVHAASSSRIPVGVPVLAIGIIIAIFVLYLLLSPKPGEDREPEKKESWDLHPHPKGSDNGIIKAAGRQRQRRAEQQALEERNRRSQLR